jgi:calcineurin-like phosphoesterase family protein
MGEHDEAIIANWNSVVRTADIVYLLGDVCMNWKGAEEKIARLNGTIHLITGNHDPMFPGNRDSHKHQAKWTGKFASIQAYARRRSGGKEFLLSHFPYDEPGGDHTAENRYAQYRLPDKGMWLLHGHTHSKIRTGENIRRSMLLGGDPLEKKEDWCWHGRQVHVGLDAWDLKPAAEDDVLKLIDEVDTRWSAVV